MRSGAEGAIDIARDEARNEINDRYPRIAIDLKGFEGDSFLEYLESGVLAVDDSFLELSPEEIAAKRRNSETTILQAASEDPMRASFLTLGFGETGGFDYANASVYICWSVELDPTTRSVSEPQDADCVEGVGQYAGNAERAYLDSD